MAGAGDIPRKELRERALSSVTKCLRNFANNWILIAGILLIIALLVISSIWDWDYWSELTFDQSHSLKEIKLDRTRIIQQLLLVVGGIAAFALAAWRTWTAHSQAKTALKQVGVALRQADLAERAHNVDRYTRAANMLESDKIAVRQAGVYTLLELGRADTVNFYTLVLKLLAGFARVRSAEFAKQEKELQRFSGRERDNDETVKFSDLHDALSSIGWLRDQHPDEVESERTAKFTLNLAGIVGARISLNEVDFSLVNLRGADFTGSYLRLGKFRRTDARYATFHGVNAQWSNFGSALFQNADVELAEFDLCNFEGASFAEAQFDSTSFSGCNISGTRFENANGLSSGMISDAWAWKDRPPSLPVGVEFDRYYDPGSNDEFRKTYWHLQPHLRGFGPPD